jgi:hypothetical protein
MTILRTTFAIAGFVLSGASLQAGFITDATAIGGAFFTSAARAQNGVLFGGTGSNFACPGGGTSSAGGVGGNVTNSFANITCESGRAFASADLVTGSLHGFALSSGIAGTQANETARLTDEVFFNNSTGGNLLLGVSYLSQGTVTGEAFGVGTTTGLLSNLLLGQPGGSLPITLQGSASGVHGLRFVYTNGSTSIQDPNAGGPPDLSGWTVLPVAGIGAVFSGTLVVPSGISTLDVATLLYIDCRSGADCDFSHTAAFSFGALPTGLSFTSSSGSFLTGASAVPEPGTWAMFSAGLIAVGILRRRKDRRRFEFSALGEFVGIDLEFLLERMYRRECAQGSRKTAILRSLPQHDGPR